MSSERFQETFTADEIREAMRGCFALASKVYSDPSRMTNDASAYECLAIRLGLLDVSAEWQAVREQKSQAAWDAIAERGTR
jgi:hypothetical protein